MSELIFITGATGFLGSHIVVQLLESGYRVRAAARGAKIEELKNAYAAYKDKFEAVLVSDLVADQFPEALKGVDALIHTASPLAARETPEVMLKVAIEGTLNVIRQAERAGIKRIVVTSSIITVTNPEGKVTDKHWNPVTREQALVPGAPMVTYGASKKFAELAVWEFADAHPNVDITTLNPPFLYGPFTKTFSAPTPNPAQLSTNLFIYRLLSPTGSYPPSPGHSDIRDVAKAHVLALRSPPTSVVGRKRLIMAAPGALDFKSIVRLIGEKRPELKSRLIDSDRAPQWPYDRTPVDFERLEEVLSFKKEEFRAVEDTILDAVDSIVELEKEWLSKGYTVNIPDA